MHRSSLNHAELLKEYPHLADFLPFLEAHNQESARGKVLVACSFLEEQLRRILAAFMVEGAESGPLLDDFNAPLGTFSARIKAAHALGLISNHERGDCDTLRRVRNEFAHSHQAAFSEPKIVALCKRLHGKAPDYGDVVVNADGQFSTAAIGLVLNLTNRAHYVSQKRLQRQNWPI